MSYRRLSLILMSEGIKGRSLSLVCGDGVGGLFLGNDFRLNPIKPSVRGGTW